LNSPVLNPRNSLTIQGDNSASFSSDISMIYPVETSMIYSTENSASFQEDNSMIYQGENPIEYQETYQIDDENYCEGGTKSTHQSSGEDGTKSSTYQSVCDDGTKSSNYQSVCDDGTKSSNYQSACDDGTKSTTYQSICEDETNPTHPSVCEDTSEQKGEETHETDYDADPVEPPVEPPLNIDIFNLTTPEDAITINNHQYIFMERTIYHMTSIKRNFFLRSKYIIKDTEGKDKYLCEFNKVGNNFITDMEGHCILLFDVKAHGRNFKLNLNSEDFIEKKEVDVTLRPSLKASKFSVNYFNPITDKEELLDVHFKLFNRTIQIYSGKKKEGGILICKAKMMNTTSPNYMVVIAPNVDIIFMIFSIFFLMQITSMKFTSVASN